MKYTVSIGFRIQGKNFKDKIWVEIEAPSRYRAALIALGEIDDWFLDHKIDPIKLEINIYDKYEAKYLPKPDWRAENERTNKR